MKKLSSIIALLAVGCGGSATPNCKSGDPYERYLGAVTLGSTGDKNDAYQACRLIQDPDPLARDGAVIAMGEIGDPGNVPRVAATLKLSCPVHPELLADVPGICAKCGKRPLERAVPNNAMVRTDAVRALARLGGGEAQASVLVALAKDESVDVRRTAAHVAAKFGSNRAVLEALVEAMGDPSAGVVYAAHGALVALTKQDKTAREKLAWRAWLDAQPK